MAKSGQERSAKAAEKQTQYDKKELRHRVRLGTRQKLGELMAWNDIEKSNEAVQNLILNAHALRPMLSYQRFRVRAAKCISENVARMSRNQSLVELKHDPGTSLSHRANYFSRPSM